MSEFKILSDEERDALTDEKKGKYLSDMIKHNNDELEVLKKELAKNNDAEIEKKLNSLLETQLSVLKSTLETQGTTMAKLMKELESSTKKENLDFKTATYKALYDAKDEIAALKSGKSTVTLEIKASQGAADIDAGTDFAQMESGVGQIATRRPFLYDLFRRVPTTKEYIKYNDQETIVRDAKNVAACAASTHNSKITWKVYTLQIQKVRDFVDVCIDMMDDYDFVTGEITNLVDTDVKLKVDSQLLLGSDVAPELNSIDAVSSTFVAGDYAGQIDTPTLVDVIKVAAAQISDFGENNKFQANVVLLNPVDATVMELEKDLNKNYLIPNWITANGINIGAVRVITHQNVPVNEAYIFDSTKGVIYERKGVTVEMAFENNDNFEKEIVTVKAYQRLNLRVRNVDANAFMHIPDIAAAKVAIATT